MCRLVLGTIQQNKWLISWYIIQIEVVSSLYFLHHGICCYGLAKISIWPNIWYNNFRQNINPNCEYSHLSMRVSSSLKLEGFRTKKYVGPIILFYWNINSLCTITYNYWNIWGLIVSFFCHTSNYYQLQFSKELSLKSRCGSTNSSSSLFQ